MNISIGRNYITAPSSVSSSPRKHVITSDSTKNGSNSSGKSFHSLGSSKVERDRSRLLAVRKSVIAVNGSVAQAVPDPNPVIRQKESVRQKFRDCDVNVQDQVLNHSRAVWLANNLKFLVKF